MNTYVLLLSAMLLGPTLATGRHRTAPSCPQSGLRIPPPGMDEQRPGPRSEFPRPPRAPSSLRGVKAIVRVLVDSTGRAVSDSTLACGVSDPEYVAELARSVNALDYVPGSIGKRIKAAYAYFVFNL